MEMITLQEAKHLIKDGDAVFVCCNAKSSFMGKFISAVTDSKVYHVGLAFWLTLPTGVKELFIVEADSGGTCITNIAQYHLQCLRVMAKPDYVKNEDYIRELFASLGSTPYSYKKSIWSAAKQYVRLPSLNDKGMFCSELVGKMWTKGGFALHDAEVDPKKLEQFLLQRGVQYRCWIKAHDREQFRKSKQLAKHRN